jgi:hypothetical protein
MEHWAGVTSGIEWVRWEERGRKGKENESDWEMYLKRRIKKECNQLGVHVTEK